MKDKLKNLLAEYGQIALGVYFVLFALTMAGFIIAFKAGFEPDSSAGTAGTIGAAWLATKATQLLRIAATLALTPVVASVARRIRTSHPLPAPRHCALPERRPGGRKPAPLTSAPCISDPRHSEGQPIKRSELPDSGSGFAARVLTQHLHPPPRPLSEGGNAG